MSKIKVYELAKELEKPSKELVEFFKEKEIDVKSHMSSVEDTEAEMARKAFLPKTAAKGAHQARIPQSRSEGSDDKGGRAGTGTEQKCDSCGGEEIAGSCKEKHGRACDARHYGGAAYHDYDIGIVVWGDVCGHTGNGACVKLFEQTKGN